MKLSNQPPKGTSDWLPAEFTIRQYIFDVWRRVCERYGYEEYLTPLVESADIYRAKSGEEVGGKELVTFKDLGGRDLAIRPEMTPSITRLVSQIYDASPKPLRYFSIANFMRNEKPQRGRNREFWQLNCDIFGSNSLNADVEVLQIALDIMLEFKPPKNSFVLKVSSRAILKELFAKLKINNKQSAEVARILDKWRKLSQAAIKESLQAIGLNKEQIKNLMAFIGSKNLPNTAAGADLKFILQALSDLGYGVYLEYDPTVVRGLDYYDGMVFEVFDNHKDNNRAMFGGGRYNGLGALFGGRSFPAVGFAPGDETTRIFLESWGLLKKIKEDTGKDIYYLPLLDKGLSKQTWRLAKSLREEGKMVECGLEAQKISKALDLANKKGLAKVIIFGADEAAKKIYKIKDMATGKEKSFKL
jgi:histidyl-tRNA synthetase